MPDNPRMPGHPSDIPSYRSTEGGAGSAASGTPGSGSTTPSTPPPSGSSTHNTQTRNIIIGAIATMIASTTVYYLTQYVNNKKTDSIPNFLVMKEATTNAWKRYVTMENIYYKSLTGLSGDFTGLSDPDKYVVEISKEVGIFKKDAGEIAIEKNVDAALKTLLTRRIGRQTEFIDELTLFVSKIKTIENEKTNTSAKQKKIAVEGAAITGSVKRLSERTATEIEELSKTLSATYAVSFDPNEVIIYANYKNRNSGPANINTKEKDDSASNEKPAVDIDPKKLLGNWDDHGNKINLRKDNIFNYSLMIGDQARGTWKMENDRLHLEAVNSVTQQKFVWLFRIENIAANSFTMTLTTKPYDIYHLVRVK